MNGREVEYLLPGSDIGAFGEYSQEGNIVKLKGSDYSYEVAADGKSIKDLRYGTIFTLKE
jgi:hypothetical protein